MGVEREVRRVLDNEPAPPPPSEPANRQDDDNRGPHIRFVFCPLILVHPDGSIGTDGWRGTALVVAYNLAAFVVVWQALQQLGAWISSTSMFGVPLLALALILGVVTVVVTFVVTTLYYVGAAMFAAHRWWCGRRARRAAA